MSSNRRSRWRISRADRSAWDGRASSPSTTASRPPWILAAPPMHVDAVVPIGGRPGALPKPFNITACPTGCPGRIHVQQQHGPDEEHHDGIHDVLQRDRISGGHCDVRRLRRRGLRLGVQQVHREAGRKHQPVVGERLLLRQFTDVRRDHRVFGPPLVSGRDAGHLRVPGDRADGVSERQPKLHGRREAASDNQRGGPRYRVVQRRHARERVALVSAAVDTGETSFHIPAMPSSFRPRHFATRRTFRSSASLCRGSSGLAALPAPA